MSTEDGTTLGMKGESSRVEDGLYVVACANGDGACRSTSSMLGWVVGSDLPSLSQPVVSRSWAPEEIDDEARMMRSIIRMLPASTKTP